MIKSGFSLRAQKFRTHINIRVVSAWKPPLSYTSRACRSFSFIEWPSKVMVVGHGNTLRALVKLVDHVSDADVFHLDLPTATPLLYESRQHARAWSLCCISA